MKNPFKKYSEQFSEGRFWQKLQRYARQIGVKTVYTGLLLFYAYQRKDTPAWAKNIILGTLGYLLAPLDMIPDLTPVLGYTDDLGVLGFGLVTVAAYINMDVKVKARKKLKAWFGKLDLTELAEIDQKI